MEKKEFDELSIDHKLEYVKINLSLFTDSVRQRMEILPSVSALSAMLIVVQSVNTNLTSLNSWTNRNGI